LASSLENLKTRVKRVTPEAAEQALSDLSGLWGKKIDLSGIQADVIFNERLGPTDSCLTLEQLVELAEGKQALRAMPHLWMCASCREAAALYQSVKRRLRRPKLRFPMQCEPIRLQTPDIVIEAYLQASEPVESVRIVRGGLIQAAECRIVRVAKPVGVATRLVEPGGTVYRVLGTIRPVKAVLKTLPSHQPIFDYIELAGITKKGRKFIAGELATFERAEASAAGSAKQASLPVGDRE
jgi:hypothetical protein